MKNKSFLNRKIVYPILSLNCICVLLAYYFRMNSVPIVIWGWSIWVLICYEHIEMLNGIADNNYYGKNKVLVNINSCIQFIFAALFSFMLFQDIHDIHIILILFFMQIIKISTSFVYRRGIPKLFNKYADLSSNEILAGIIRGLKCPSLVINSKEMKENNMLLPAAYISFFCSIVWIPIANLIINIWDNTILQIILLAIFILIIGTVNLSIYCYNNDNYIKCFISTAGCIISFIILNDIGNFITGAFPIRIFFSVYCLSPHILYLRKIVKEYQLMNI